jgi:hypothetical protein
MADMFNTVNGQKSVGQMQAELQQAGWGGGEDVASAYARTTGGAVTQGAPSTTTTTTTPTAPGTPAVPVQGANVNAAQMLLSQAQQAAYQAYLNARLNLETDAQAFSQAQQAFTNHITEAGLTGTYNGQPTLAAQAQQQSTANDYLKLIAGLRGPQDYGQYLKVLASTPGGMKDLVASAAGRYVPGGGTTGVQPTPVSLGGVVGQATAGAGVGQGAAPAGPLLQVTGTDPATGNPLYQTRSGPKTEMQIYTELNNAGYTGAQDITSKLQAYQTMGGGGGTASPQQAQYADYMATASGLPAPNQISPAAYNAYTTTQKQLLSGMYEAQGFNPQDVTDLYKQSLPRYAYSGPTTGTVKLG